MKQLFCDCKTDEEKSNFFLSGRAVESGVIAPALVNDVAMAYHRCAEFKKETDTLRAKVEAMEKQKPVAWARKLGMDLPSFGCVTDLKYRPSDMPESAYMPLYALPGAQPAQSVPDVDALAQLIREIDGKHQLGAGALAERIVEWLAAAPEAKPCP